MQAVNNDATGDGDRSNLHDCMSVATGPCFKVERRDLLQFFGIEDLPGRAADQHAPAFAEGLIDAINLEADRGYLGEHIGLRLVGAENDLPAREFEVDWKRNRPSFGREDDSPHTACGQMGVTVLPGQRLQRRMAACSSPPWRPLDIAAREGERGRIEGESEEIEGSGTQASVGIALEVLEIVGIDTHLLGELVGGETKLISALDHPPGQIAWTSERGRIGFRARARAADGANWRCGVRSWCHGIHCELEYGRPIGRKVPMKDDLGLLATEAKTRGGRGQMRAGDDRVASGVDPATLLLADNHNRAMGMSCTVGTHRPQQKLAKAAVSS